MNQIPDEKKTEELAAQDKALSDSELEQVSGGLPGWLKKELDPEVLDHLK